MAFNNTGTVNIESGTLELRGGGTQSGTINTTGGVLSLTAGTYTLGAGSVFNQAALTVSGVTLNLNAFGGTLTSINATGSTLNFGVNTTLVDLTLNSSTTVGGAGNLTVTGTFNWTSGTLQNGSELIVASGATANLTGGGAKDFNRTLRNRGTVNYLGTGLRFSTNNTNPGRIENEAGAGFLVDGDGDFDHLFANANVFNNAGTLTKRGAGLTSFFASTVAFNNTGVVSVQSGTLQYQAVFSQTAAAAQTQISGGTLTAASALTFAAGHLDLLSGALTQNVTMGAGTTLTAGPAKFSITGTLTLNSTARLELTLGGGTGTAHAALGVSGAATLNGTLALTLGSGFAESQGVTFPAFTFGSRSGDFTAVEGLSQFGYVFTRAFTATAQNLVVQTGGVAPSFAPSGSFTEFVQNAFGPQATGTGPVCAPDKDPDRDGLCNLLEFALGTDPANGASCSKPTMGTITLDGEVYPTIRYTRSTTAAGVALVVEVSSNLTAWSANTPDATVTQTISVTADPLHPGCETVVEAAVTPMSQNPSVFLRLRAILTSQ